MRYVLTTPPIIPPIMLITNAVVPETPILDVIFKVPKPSRLEKVLEERASPICTLSGFVNIGD
jgi:hypothetical protein